MSRPSLPVTVSPEEKRFLMECGFALRDARREEESAAVFRGVLPLVEDKHLPVIGLGTIDFFGGRFDAAIEQFEEATRMAPTFALGYAHLGEALAFARQQEEAELALRKASDLDPVGAEGGEMARTLQKFLAYGLL